MIIEKERFIRIFRSLFKFHLLSRSGSEGDSVLFEEFNLERLDSIKEGGIQGKGFKGLLGI